MPITQADAQAVTRDFLADYPGGLALGYRFRPTVADLYGDHADQVPATMKGGFVAQPVEFAGRTYHCRVDIPLDNIRDAEDMVLTLRHEVLGHFGINTFTPQEKRALLDTIIAARTAPEVADVWSGVDSRYAGRSLDVRAEEVYALVAETVESLTHTLNPSVADLGRLAFLDTCIDRRRLLDLEDLFAITHMVAHSLHTGRGIQQTFPYVNEIKTRYEDMDSQAKKPFHETVAEKLIEQLKAGTAPWQRPWEGGDQYGYLPYNPTTGKRYKGINAVMLLSQDRADTRWMTYKQAAAEGAQVRKGEKGTAVQYWKFTDERDKLDDAGRPVNGPDGMPVKETVKLQRPRVFFAVVFNAEQIDGLPAPQPREPLHSWDAVERAEHILKASGADIRHSPSNQAFYRPATDSIHMPARDQFPSADRYYAIALHELGHWTGHPDRLARDLAHPFGSEGYAREELRAEIASMLLGDEMGIGHDPGQHVAYVQSWIKALEHDPMEIFRASADAEKIHDYVLAFEQQQIQDQAQTQDKRAAITNAIQEGLAGIADWGDTQEGRDAHSDARAALSALEAGDDEKALVLLHVAAGWEVIAAREARPFGTAAGLLQAEIEAQRMAEAPWLAVDVAQVLTDPTTSYDHYGAYFGAPESSLDAALRNHGLTTVASITGTDPDRFFDTAIKRLSPVFDIAVDHPATDDAYLERKGLAQAFAAKAEQLALARPAAAHGLPQERVYTLRKDEGEGFGDRDVEYDNLDQAIGAFLDADPMTRPRLLEADKTIIELDPDSGMSAMFMGDGSEKVAFDQVVANRHGATDTATHATPAPAHPRAFFDTNGFLREWTTADPLPNTWQGIAKNNDRFFFIGQDNGERSFTALQAKNYEGARNEAAGLHQAHELPLSAFAELANVEALEIHGRRWNVTMGGASCFSDATRTDAAIADAHAAAVNNALYFNSAEGRRHGVTVSLPPVAVLAEYPDLVAKFPDALTARPSTEESMQTAPEPIPMATASMGGHTIVFNSEGGLRGAEVHAPDGSVTSFGGMPAVESYIAEFRLDSADADALRRFEAMAQADRGANSALLGHLKAGTIGEAMAALDRASLAEVDATMDALAAMQPLNTQNPYWQRHELPENVEELGQRIDKALEHLGETRRPVAVLEATRLAVLEAGASATAAQKAAYAVAAGDALGFTLPADWTGQVRTAGMVLRDDEYVEAGPGDQPEVYAVFARRDVAPGAIPMEFLTAFGTPEEADAMAGRLALIDAASTAAPHDKAAKYAWIEEQRIRRDPNSTQADRIEAKEARKAAEVAAIRHQAEQQQAAQGGQEATAPAQATRQYIDVPFREKDEAKALGAAWDGKRRSWYVPAGKDLAPFSKWAADTAPPAAAHTAGPGPDAGGERVYLAVPYSDRKAAKEAGASWDKAAKSWYAGANADMAKLSRWLPDTARAAAEPTITPKEELAETLREMGFILSGEHPIMDGSRQRLAVEGDKKGELSGSYRAFHDGRPSATIKNWRTGAASKWSSKGALLTPEQKAVLSAEAAQKKEDREAEQARAHAATADRITKLIESLSPVTTPTPYMDVKGIRPHAEAMTDKDGKTTYIPAMDADGKVWTMQFIQEGGAKRFAKDSRKDGCFHPVGGLDAVAAAPALVVAEGYATAATLAEELGQATVAAFDAGNLPAVVRALHSKYPDKPVIVAGDNDQHHVMMYGTNPGQTKAEEAAVAVGGVAIFPIFAPGENAYPVDRAPFSTDQFRAHERAAARLEKAAADPEAVALSEQEAAKLKAALLSDDQLAGLAGMKAHTDFNDLAARSVLGREAVGRQAGAAIRQALDQVEHQEQAQHQEQKQVQAPPREQQKARRSMRV